MKTILKSQNFYSGIAGALLVLLVLFIVREYKSDKQNIIVDTTGKQSVKQNTTPQVYRASYSPQQAVDFTFAAEKSINAVVHIKTETISRTNSYNNFFGQFQEYLHERQPHQNSYVAFGSGVILSPDGYIVTNNHVIDGASKISVTFNDERETEAVVVGVDPNTDLALIKVNETDLPYLTFGNSDKLKVGEWVLAVGNPFNLNSTVTAGIISAKARNINISRKQTIESFIQTDAVVNRGNSGGALVNTNGELVGINAAIASHTGVYEGYSFAIPVNIVKKVVADLKKYGEVQMGYLGVQIQDIDAEFAKTINLKSTEGVYVAAVVENSGAADAGIKKGDIIMDVNGIATNSLSSLLGIVAQYNPGTVVNVKINRDNNLSDYDVILKNRSGNTAVVKSGDEFTNDMLGIELQQATVDELNELGIANGLRIIKIHDGMLSNSGIQEGFIITDINGIKVNSEQNLKTALSKSERRVIRLKGVYPNGVKVAYEFMF